MTGLECRQFVTKKVSAPSNPLLKQFVYDR